MAVVNNSNRGYAHTRQVQIRFEEARRTKVNNCSSVFCSPALAKCNHLPHTHTFKQSICFERETDAVCTTAQIGPEKTDEDEKTFKFETHTRHSYSIDSRWVRNAGQSQIRKKWKVGAIMCVPCQCQRVVRAWTVGRSCKFATKKKNRKTNTRIAHTNLNSQLVRCPAPRAWVQWNRARPTETLKPHFHGEGFVRSEFG